MTKNELHDFFVKKQKDADAAGKGVDWEARKAEWKQATEDFYKLVSGFISDLSHEGLVKVSYRPKQVVEQYLGTYEVREMVLLAGGEEVVFSPMGRNIVGAVGRIDLIGEMAEATFVLFPDQGWKVLMHPGRKSVPLTQENFAEVLRNVMRK
jgi:hypothetical protein